MAIQCQEEQRKAVLWSPLMPNVNFCPHFPSLQLNFTQLGWMGDGEVGSGGIYPLAPAFGWQS